MKNIIGWVAVIGLVVVVYNNYSKMKQDKKITNVKKV